MTGPVEWSKAQSLKSLSTISSVQHGGNHYLNLSIQPSDYIIKNKLNFCEGNVIKYVTRHRNKGQAADIKKAIHYCLMLLESEYGESYDETT